MKITALYVYPIKALRGIELQHASVGPQGIKYDRRFMLFEVRPPAGELKKMQLSSYPQCALFEQEIIHRNVSSKESGAAIAVRYCPPKNEAATLPSMGPSEERQTLQVPLEPDHAALEKIDVDLHRSGTTAYRMGDFFDEWFSACFGFPVTLLYIGDGRRAVLGTSMLPRHIPTAGQPAARNKSWLSSLTSYVATPPPPHAPPQPWLTFTDVAPLLVTSEASLREVSARLPNDQPMAMYKFRPNIIVDGEGEAAWAEDFWAELVVMSGENRHSVLLTGNCGRCTSLNVDYRTGKQAEGELGTVLKKLMKDRRVDAGAKWSPIFGRYASLGGQSGDGFVSISVGDEVRVVRRNMERSVWDWPGL